MKRKQKIILATIAVCIVIFAGAAYNYYSSNHVFTDYEEITTSTDPILIDHEVKKFKQLEKILYEDRLASPEAAFVHIVSKNYYISISTKYAKIAYDDYSVYVYNNKGTVEVPAQANTV